MKDLRHSRIIYGLYFATLILFCLPESMIRFIVKKLSKCHTGFFTNFYSSKDICIFNGKKQIGHFAFAAPVADVTVSISLVTIGNLMGLSIFSNSHGIPEP